MKPSTSARTQEPQCWKSTRRKCRSALPAHSRDLSRFSNPQSSASTNNAGYTKNWRRRWRPFTERKKKRAIKNSSVAIQQRDEGPPFPNWATPYPLLWPAALGHLERFPPERVSGRCQIGQGTSAGAYSGDGLAPKAAIAESFSRVFGATD